VKKFVAGLNKRVDSKQLSITHEATKEVSGKFEISLKGTVIHSKAAGDGFVDTEAKWNNILQKLSAAGVELRTLQ